MVDRIIKKKNQKTTTRSPHTQIQKKNKKNSSHCVCQVTTLLLLLLLLAAALLVVVNERRRRRCWRPRYDFCVENGEILSVCVCARNRDLRAACVSLCAGSPLCVCVIKQEKCSAERVNARNDDDGGRRRSFLSFTNKCAMCVQRVIIMSCWTLSCIQFVYPNERNIVLGAADVCWLFFPPAGLCAHLHDCTKFFHWSSFSLWIYFNTTTTTTTMSERRVRKKFKRKITHSRSTTQQMTLTHRQNGGFVFGAAFFSIKYMRRTHFL